MEFWVNDKKLKLDKMPFSNVVLMPASLDAERFKHYIALDFGKKNETKIRT